MPAIIHTDQGSTSFGYGSSEFDYAYPEGLDLRPNSALHTTLKNAILQRARESNGAVSKRFPSWRTIDRTLTTYIDLSESEEKVVDESLGGDPRKPVSIVFPYSYAILESILSYLVAAFFQEPVFRYEGVSPEDELGSIMLEKLIDLHCNKTKVLLSLHTMFRDGLAYGVGIGVPSWQKRYGMKTVKQETGFMSAFTGLFQRQGTQKTSVRDLIFEGNELLNVDPYLCLPDPNVSIHDLQRGEYFGWLERTNIMELLSREQTGEDYFNVQYVKQVSNKTSFLFSTDASDRQLKSGGPWRTNSTVTLNPVDLVHLYVRLVPKEWKLGSSEYPEKWIFSLAADDVIVRARPIGLNHDLFPVVVCAPDFDGYSSCPISRIETLYGLQGTLDWLFNMHIANVRKTINDMLVVDPYLVNINDVTKPGAGKVIRMRRPAWGRGTKDAVTQLAVVDVTKQHINDSAVIVNWMQKVAGADDSMMGSLRQGGPERLTGAEFKGTQTGQISRLERMAKVIGLQAMQDIGYMFASHAQQLMERETWVKGLGRWQEVITAEYSNQLQKGRMKVTPLDLIVEYDVKVRDGSIPGGNFSEIWVRMFETLTANPELMQTFDTTRIFKYIARNLGAKNVDEFIRIKKMPDEQVADQVQRGNVVPLQEAA